MNGAFTTEELDRIIKGENEENQPAELIVIETFEKEEKVVQKRQPIFSNHSFRSQEANYFDEMVHSIDMIRARSKYGIIERRQPALNYNESLRVDYNRKLIKNNHSFDYKCKELPLYSMTSIAHEYLKAKGYKVNKNEYNSFLLGDSSSFSCRYPSQKEIAERKALAEKAAADKIEKQIQNRRDKYLAKEWVIDIRKGNPILESDISKIRRIIGSSMVIFYEEKTSLGYEWSIHSISIVPSIVNRKISLAYLITQDSEYQEKRSSDWVQNILTTVIVPLLGLMEETGCTYSSEEIMELIDGKRDRCVLTNKKCFSAESPSYGIRDIIIPDDSASIFLIVDKTWDDIGNGRLSYTVTLDVLFDNGSRALIPMYEGEVKQGENGRTWNPDRLDTIDRSILSVPRDISISKRLSTVSYMRKAGFSADTESENSFIEGSSSRLRMDRNIETHDKL